MKTDLLQSCGHCWGFQICWHIECNNLTASSFMIWNSSTGIPSLPLALFIVMLPKAQLTSHSRMSGSGWVITPLWLSGSWRSFFYSSVYSCHLFLISSASLRSIQFLSFIVPIFAWNFPLVSNFLEEFSHAALLQPKHYIHSLQTFFLFLSLGFYFIASSMFSNSINPIQNTMLPFLMSSRLTVLSPGTHVCLHPSEGNFPCM